jgi:hydroxyacylglutathione hydrolase
MLASLDKLAALPGNTRVCAAHEYTLGNLAFAAVVDGTNPHLPPWRAQAQALRAQRLPTLPSTLATERNINPFLRTRHPALVQAAQLVDATVSDEVSVFAALRHWKDMFKP